VFHHVEPILHPPTPLRAGPYAQAAALAECIALLDERFSFLARRLGHSAHDPTPVGDGPGREPTGRIGRPLPGVIFADVPTGFEAIREQLAERRSVGQSFADAWPEVIRGIGEPTDRRVLNETREQWQEAYEVVQQANRLATHPVE